MRGRILGSGLIDLHGVSHVFSQSAVSHVPDTNEKVDPAKICHTCKNEGHWKGECSNKRPDDHSFGG